MHTRNTMVRMCVNDYIECGEVCKVNTPFMHLASIFVGMSGPNFLREALWSENDMVTIQVLT